MNVLHFNALGCRWPAAPICTTAVSTQRASSATMRSLAACVFCVALLTLLFSQQATAQSSPGTIFLPQTCRTLCEGKKLFNVADFNDDFLSIDPASNSSTTFRTSRASTWAVAFLAMVREAVTSAGQPGQSVTITPPAVARVLGGYSLAVYQSFAVYSEYVYAYGRSFHPLGSDMVNLKDPSLAAQWDVLTEPYEDIFPGDFAPTESAAGSAMRAAISGAASKFISLFFCNDRRTQAVWCAKADEVLNSTMAFVGNKDREAYPVPFRQGEDIATLVFDQLSMTDLLKDNAPTLSATFPEVGAIRPSQPTPAVHQCANLQRGWWYWQRLTVPRSKAVFTPNANPTLSPFPPESYRSLSASETTTPFFRGFAAALSKPALRSTEEGRAMLLGGLNGPPVQSDLPGLGSAMRQVLQQSATLDDRKKVVAEFWADGPESTTPPGHWFKIAVEESNTNAAFALKGLDIVDRTVWATLLVGLSLHEAGLLAWELKLKHMGSRPITGIQCGLGVDAATNTTRIGRAWRGPYMGVGRRNLNTWQPFQAINFITPPFAGYVSGHASFSSAAAEALRQVRSAQNTSFTTLGYNCYLTPRGFSTIEPRVTAGNLGYVAGVTDRPNRGPTSIGFSPARDVVLCWQTYEQAAQQAAVSRLYGGIHISIDNDDGLKLGKRIGETVAANLAGLSPERYRTKVEFERAAPLPSFNLEIYSDNHVQELVCPPGTFVRSWDGRQDANGLYALAITCSDGTFLGDVGSWARGEPFATATQSDGYYGITAVTDGAGSVVGLSFTDRLDDVSPTYGASGSSQFTQCREAQRVVGLAVRETTGRGNIGTLGLLCGEVQADDASERLQPVPADTETQGRWYYDLQCPDDTFITRVFGRAGSYITSLTAQCSRTWNLKTVGMPSTAQPDDAYYSHTSTGGFSGIEVNSYSGSVDSIRFRNMTGGMSPAVGHADVPGAWTPLTCSDESRMIGIFGWADNSVVSIGIICSPGEFAAVASLAPKQLRIKRNPAPKARFPGGPVLYDPASEVQTMTITLPTTRIPTHVSPGKGRKASSRTGTLPPSPAPTAVVTGEGATLLPNATAGQALFEARPVDSSGNGSVVEEAGVASGGSPANSSWPHNTAAVLDH